MFLTAELLVGNFEVLEFERLELGFGFGGGSVVGV
jgi:hypothetical protein